MKKTLYHTKNYLKGVSTLVKVSKNLRIILLLFVASSLTSFARGAQSTLDLVDPSFNPQITTTSFGTKSVSAIEVLPDGKILAAGNFNSYNRQTVGGLVRLNPDGSLDTTFNNNVAATNLYIHGMLLQPDGKIVLYGLDIKRFNSDGTVDSGFNYTHVGGLISDAAIDASGRLIISGNSFSSGKLVLRLNQNGSIDSSFNFNATESLAGGVALATQNNKVLVDISGPSPLKRLNEDGSVDPTFNQVESAFAYVKLIVQPDKKILFIGGLYLQRFNENGAIDNTFQRVTFSNANPPKIRLGNDGKITVLTPVQAEFRRFLPSGQVDQSFTQFVNIRAFSFALQLDGSIIVGDFSGGFHQSPEIPNWFARYTPSGTLDTSFNRDGFGFQTVTSNANQAFVRAIALQANGKVLVGGKFDEVNGVFRSKIARLNGDSTVDTSFKINGSGTGNYFSRILEFYNIRVQPDGKIIATGNFEYFINGVAKYNLVRFNSDGSIDSTFNLAVSINDFFGTSGGGTNKFVSYNDGKLMVASSRQDLPGFTTLAPIKLTETGAVDNSFNPTMPNSVFTHDLAIQPDGKIIFCGRYQTLVPGTSNTIFKSFVVRLNPDGSKDQSFQAAEDTDKTVFALVLLPNGKILVAKGSPFTVTAQNDVVRLNSDGSVDNSFNAGTGADGRINSIKTLPSGDIFVGGRFTTFNGKPRQNLARLNANGSLDPAIYNVNDEVLSLEIDSEGRILVGGKFTSISAGGGNSNRTNIARLIDSEQSNRRTRFDFDGDGRADLGVFDNTNGDWSIRSSQTSQASNSHFGQAGDKMAAADFDGDGKTDRAVYRPSEGVWYLMQSTAGFSAVRWGSSEDKPVPADYDGDGKADVAVWRASTRIWYIWQSSNNQMKAVQWGLTSDLLLPNADFDGDGRADVAVFRPSNGTFYWLSSAANDQFKAMQFGQSGDIPAVGDFNGDGKSDFVVFRPSDGFWYQYLTTPNNGSYTFFGIKWGQNGDEPVAADYDGDGKTDIAVRRQGIWYLLMSEQGIAGSGFGSITAQAIAGLPNQ